MFELTAPTLRHDETRSAMPPGVRQFLGLVGVSDFLDQTLAESTRPRT